MSLSTVAKKDLQLTAIARATDEFLDEVRQRKLENPSNIIDEFVERYPDIRLNIEELFPPNRYTYDDSPTTKEQRRRHFQSLGRSGVADAERM